MYLRATIEFGEISENCDFWSKMRFFFFFFFVVVFLGFFHQKFEKLFFGSNCSSFILQLNAETRINIRAVNNEIHVFKFFLYGIYMVAILSKFRVVYKLVWCKTMRRIYKNQKHLT